MPRSRVALIVFIQCAALMAVCLFVGDNGWDDGAITLAFARTFARHGRIALTPRSEVVEGFSSVSWFLLNGLAALARPSYRATILISQVLSVLCIGGCTALLARSCRLLRLDGFCSAVTLMAFAAWGCSFSEAANGMEMGLLAGASLLIINELLSDGPRLPWLCAGVAVAITTRFEAILYVGLLGLSVFSVPGRRAFWAIVATALVTLALLSGWRVATFSDVLPNTFWAKRWPPYAGFGLGGRLAGALELPSFFVVPVVALAVLGRGSLATTARTRRRPIAILAAAIAGAVGMGLLTGRHWGYYGRMPYFAFAPALLLVGLLFSDWIARGEGRLRRAVAAGSVGAAVAVSMVGLPFAAWGAARAGGGFGVTPHTYAESGQIFRRFGATSVLTSDVGGLALCCDELRIVDLAFLSNRTLAHAGPAAIAQVLDSERPDLIEAHWEWATAGHLYDLPGFRAGYAPAFAAGTKLWIRRELADAIQRQGRGCWAPIERPDVQRALQGHRYARADRPLDRETFAAAGPVFALDLCQR